MSKLLQTAVISSLILGGGLLTACGKKAEKPAEKAKPAATAPAKPVKKVEATPAATPAPAPAPKPAAMTPEAAGKKVFNRCRACHTIDASKKNRVGPHLYGVFGRTSGTAEGFNYSKAMKASNIVWNEDTLDQYLTSPKKMVPGNKMSFIGLKKEADRKNVIAYLKANSGAK